MGKINVMLATLMLLLGCSVLPLGVAAEGIGTMEIEEKILHTGLSGKGSEFAVSPDGKHLLFTTGSLPHGLRVLDSQSGRTEVIPMEVGRVWEMPRWAPDGKQVVAISTVVRDNHYIVGDMQVILIDPKTWKYRSISSGEGVKIFPFFSADKSLVYFFKGVKRTSGATPASGFDLYAINVTTGKEEQLTHERFYQISRGDEDGKSVLFGGAPRVKNVRDAGTKTQNAIFQYSKTDQRLIPVGIAQSVGLSNIHSLAHNLVDAMLQPGALMEIRSPIRDKAGNLFFVAAKSRPGGGPYQWFVFRANDANKPPILLTELPVAVGLGFDLARQTGEIYVMDKRADEIIFRRLRALANH
jgi:hypothetical protein